MASDKRYQATGEVPDIRGDFDSKYSIGGQFKEGRAAYLDHSATTPLDPRVLDAMAPFMVSSISIACTWKQYSQRKMECVCCCYADYIDIHF